MTSALDTSSVAQAQRDRWNDEAGHAWVAGASRFDALLEPMGTAVLDAAELGPGLHVLDVGCGSGQMSRQAATRVYPDGSVTGVDISRPLLDLARRRAGDEGRHNLTHLEADAGRVDLPAASFDRIVSRFGVMFFADPPAAFAHLGSLLRPGGRFHAVCWRPAAESEFFALPGLAIAEVAPDAVGAVTEGPGPFALADPDGCRRLLEGAGLVDIGVDPLDLRLFAGASVDDALAFVASGSQLAGLRAADPARADAVLATLRPRFYERLTDDGVMLGGAAWLLSGRREG